MRQVVGRWMPGAAVMMRQVWGEGWRSDEGGGRGGDDATGVARGLTAR
ncbi:hypothetical protein [Sinisalibacter aestuarii]|nr:hypothetical protein [Sinisalibacter aestuarii]